MAQSTDPSLTDPLLSLRRSLASSNPPILTTSPDLSSSAATTDLAKATHLYVTSPIPQSIPLSAPTRFVSAAADNKAIDLRSIYFAWLKKDVAIPEYIAEAQTLNEELAKAGDKGDKDKGAAEGVVNLVFVERLDLITWLEGASEESEYIKPLEGVPAAAGAEAGAGAPDSVAKKAEDSAKVASGALGGVATVPSGGVSAVPAASAAGARPGKVIDPRLQVIYNGERKIGDRNSVLRGIKPTDFSHIRKTAEMFLGRGRSRPGQYPPKPGMKTPGPTAGPGSIAKRPSGSSSRPHPYPIILLSPSASSLLRMSNIKSFLSDGVFVPADHPVLASSTASNLLQISRTLQTVNDPAHPTPTSSSGATSKKPTRFILVDSTSDFKPEYWNRVVAVFTTGQTWQFKSYRWTSPPELFKHATGIYVGWRGEEVPREVKGWGRGVKSFAIDRWDEKSAGQLVNAVVGGGGTAGQQQQQAYGASARWRDRGVVEGIWMAIEEGMRARGWGTK